MQTNAFYFIYINITCIIKWKELTERILSEMFSNDANNKSFLPCCNGWELQCIDWMEFACDELLYDGNWWGNSCRRWGFVLPRILMERRHCVKLERQHTFEVLAESIRRCHQATLSTAGNHLINAIPTTEKRLIMTCEVLIALYVTSRVSNACTCSFW